MPATRAGRTVLRNGRKTGNRRHGSVNRADGITWQPPDAPAFACFVACTTDRRPVTPLHEDHSLMAGEIRPTPSRRAKSRIETIGGHGCAATTLMPVVLAGAFHGSRSLLLGERPGPPSRLAHAGGVFARADHGRRRRRRAATGKTWRGLGRRQGGRERCATGSCPLGASWRGARWPHWCCSPTPRRSTAADRARAVGVAAKGLALMAFSGALCNSGGLDGGRRAV